MDRIDEIRARLAAALKGSAKDDAIFLGHVKDDLAYLLTRIERAEKDRDKWYAENERLRETAKACEECDIAKRDFAHAQDPKYAEFACMREQIANLRTALSAAEAERDALEIELEVYSPHNCLLCEHRGKTGSYGKECGNPERCNGGKGFKRRGAKGESQNE